MAEKLTIEEVERIAALARIGVYHDEMDKIREDLGAVLDYVQNLKKVDVYGVEATANISGAENETRADENGSSHVTPQRLMDMAPETKDGYVKVKQVLTK